MEKKTELFLPNFQTSVNLHFLLKDFINKNLENASVLSQEGAEKGESKIFSFEKLFSN